MFAQISQAQINRLSNEQLDLLREELQSQNTEDVVPSVDKVEISPIESLLLKIIYLDMITLIEKSIFMIIFQPLKTSNLGPEMKLYFLYGENPT